MGKTIAQSLVEGKLAACVNIISGGLQPHAHMPAEARLPYTTQCAHPHSHSPTGVESVYWWDGKVQSDAELLLKIKTKTALVPELTSRVKELHPYDECEVTAVQVSGGSGSYLAWVLDSTKEAA